LTDKTPSIFLLSLGCSKNQVDSEGMRGLLAAQGWKLLEQPDTAQVIIVNTCGFIQPAQEGSIAALLEAASYKRTGACRLLIAVGCLVEKYRDELAQALPEVDAFLGSQEYGRIAALVAEKLLLPPAPAMALPELYTQRALLSPPWLAYIKIAEGCDNRCAYCLIPQLRGPYRSRPLAEIVAEARDLARRGVQELVLLAQDTTAYGRDLQGKPLLPELLTELAALPFLWVRLLYAYPDGVDAALLTVIATHDTICPYLDLPLQHGDDGILRAMGRRLSSAQLREKIVLIRSYIPDIALRTTMMVGFPGETETAFRNMLDFLREIHCDWLGAFPYSREEDTPAYNLPGQVDEATKARRLDATLQVAAAITDERLQRHLGHILTVLAEAPAEQEYGPGWWRGRSAYQAPEVDGAVYFCARSVKPGAVLRVQITGSEVYDLLGEEVGYEKE